MSKIIDTYLCPECGTLRWDKKTCCGVSPDKLYYKFIQDNDDLPYYKFVEVPLLEDELFEITI